MYELLDDTFFKKLELSSHTESDMFLAMGTSCPVNHNYLRYGLLSLIPDNLLEQPTTIKKLMKNGFGAKNSVFFLFGLKGLNLIMDQILNKIEEEVHTDLNLIEKNFSKKQVDFNSAEKLLGRKESLHKIFYEVFKLKKMIKFAKAEGKELGTLEIAIKELAELFNIAGFIYSAPFKFRSKYYETTFEKVVEDNLAEELLPKPAPKIGVDDFKNNKIENDASEIESISVMRDEGKESTGKKITLKTGEFLEINKKFNILKKMIKDKSNNSHFHDLFKDFVDNYLEENKSSKKAYFYVKDFIDGNSNREGILFSSAKIFEAHFRKKKIKKWNIGKKKEKIN